MKKAAPVKESGLGMMPANSNSWNIETHEQFLLSELLPLVIGYAKGNRHPSSAAALASFITLSTVLQSEGFTRNSLIASIDASRMDIHNAPEVLQ
ncbi:hypothetical protein G7015_09565 [Pseudomonas kunmingensis]|uniref:hypothetical protein n=1 Tax=Stutzerimonas kunmingensis TaxID=1211807 RepID=UPI0015E4868A|nr:hypothetical protein [Stutzerimonas kunmingensis]MBA1238722.1 hypothetical protein [Stutzerimonas kunmingensis]